MGFSENQIKKILSPIQRSLSSICRKLDNLNASNGLSTFIPVCYDDNTTGYTSILADGTTVTTIYFDDQYAQVTGKTIIPCNSNPIQLTSSAGDLLEGCGLEALFAN